MPRWCDSTVPQCAVVQLCKYEVTCCAGTRTWASLENTRNIAILFIFSVDRSGWNIHTGDKDKIQEDRSSQEEIRMEKGKLRHKSHRRKKKKRSKYPRVY